MKKGYKQDLSGQTFGDLKIDSFAFVKNTHSYWNCTCLRCGNKCIRNVTYLFTKDIPTCDACSIDRRVSNRKQNYVQYKDDYAIINDKIIVDKEDVNKLLSQNRHLKVSNRGYAYFKYHRETYFLHRFLMGLPREYDYDTTLIVDHINGNTLDNRKSNLRICPKEKNAINCKLYKNNKSGYKGINYVKRLDSWQVGISKKGKTVYLGTYKKLEDAIKVRKEAEEKYYGEYARKEL